MKKITLVFFLAAFLGFAQLSHAQNLAHINSLELVQAMPESTKADDVLKTLSDQKAADLKKQEEALKTKYDTFMNAYKSKSDAELQKLQNEIQTKQAELQKDAQALDDTRQAAAKELQQKQTELYEPIYKKAQDGINAVAKAKGYLYVFDSSNGALLYLGGQDILNEVKANLGIK
ncbi:MAG: OmpH family outer membrane protein [Flavobacteriaceae bacterium]|jgi:outer membrane protein|nr:OmpH family outer membrane protein [Flavobacteriaceae bacterium]